MHEALERPCEAAPGSPIFGAVSCSVEISSLSSPHVNMSISNHSTTRKSWRSDAPIILPGWECHTGGSRSKPTVHRCRPKTGGCGLLTRTQDEPTKNNMLSTVSNRKLCTNSGISYVAASSPRVTFRLSLYRCPPHLQLSRRSKRWTHPADVWPRLTVTV